MCEENLLTLLRKVMVVAKSRKEIIRETAIQVMAECGYHNSTTDRIAQEAGMAVGTIYNYFRNKEEILDYIFAIELKKRQAAYSEQLQSTKPVLEKLEALLELHFAEIARNIPVGQILVREQPLRGKAGITGISAFLQEVPGWIEELLKMGVKQGELRPCNTRILAAGIFGAVQGVAAQAVFTENEDLRNQVLKNAPGELMDLFTQGIGQGR